VERVRLEPAAEADAQVLTKISKRAFHSDVSCGAPGEGGPPGYHSKGWQAGVIGSATAYLKTLVDGSTAGGVIVWDRRNGHYSLGRIYLDPIYHRRGIGVKATDLLFERFPDAERWTLDTPTWNTRTRSFYQKLGFSVVKETPEFLYFEKQM